MDKLTVMQWQSTPIRMGALDIILETFRWTQYNLIFRALWIRFPNFLGDKSFAVMWQPAKQMINQNGGCNMSRKRLTIMIIPTFIVWWWKSMLLYAVGCEMQISFYPTVILATCRCNNLFHSRASRWCQYMVVCFMQQASLLFSFHKQNLLYFHIVRRHSGMLVPRR